MKVLSNGLKLLAIAMLALVPSRAAGADMAYIKHSSGLALGNKGGAAVLVAIDDAEPMALVDAGDGWLNICAPGPDGASLYLSKTGSWNTSFVSSGQADEAKFRIDGDLEGYVRIFCKANDRCLGVDETEAGKNVYSDKLGTDIKYQWFITSDPDGQPDLSVALYNINASDLRNTTEGWGVSLCWWANMCGKWPEKKINKIIDWLVSPDGLNYNIFRYNIGGGDDPGNANCTPHHMGSGKGLRAEMEGFKDSADDQYHWDRDAAQRTIMLKIKEMRPDAIFEAFSNTPPWYMTVSGCCSGHAEGGKDNLRADCYEAFARYLVDVCVHYRDEYGIEFRTLEPFNESNSDYWHCSGVQEGCHFDYSTQIAIIKLLHPMIKEAGLRTEISASDETAVLPAIWGFNEYKAAGITGLVGQWNTHTYWGSNSDRAQYRDLVRATGSRLWMSETGSGGNGIEGNLSMAQRLIDDIRYIEPDAWLDWQYIEEKNDQWCLVRGDFAAATSYKVKNYYVRQHFSKHIKAGYTFVFNDNEQSLAALSPGADTLVVVTVNNMPAEKTLKAVIAGFEPSADIKAYLTTEDTNAKLADIASINGNRLEYAMPATSVCTIIIPSTAAGLGIEPASEPAKWRVEAGELIVDGAPECEVRVYTLAGTLAYKGAAPAAVALPRGVYLLSAADGARRMTARVLVQ